MTKDELSAFLLKAKLSGYTAEGEGNKIILDDGGNEYYRLTYLGGSIAE